MKKDLFTAVVTAVLGAVVAFVLTNIMLPEIENVSFKILGSESGYNNLTDPNAEIFNYRAVNPTVEVYVGECDEYGEGGECVVIEEEDDSDLINPDEENAENPESPEDSGEENLNDGATD